MNDLLNVLLIYLFVFPFPYLGTGAATLGVWQGEVRHTEDLFEAARRISLRQRSYYDFPLRNSLIEVLHSTAPRHPWWPRGPTTLSTCGDVRDGLARAPEVPLG